MKRRLFLATALFTAVIAGAAYASSIPSTIYKHHMHQLFDSFNHAQISLSLKKPDIADIYLRYMQESIAEAKRFIPPTDMEGRKMDREKFSANFAILESRIGELRKKIAGGDAKEAKTLQQAIMDACAGCHKEARLQYLFKAPRRATLFGEYMHKVSYHMDLAWIFMEEGGHLKDAEENIRLVNYYLDLLETTFPEAGPSGVILDKEGFMKRIKDMRSINDAILNEKAEKRTETIDAFRKSLNTLCVACHEPERLK